jgi:hypothetical protein
LSRSEGADQEMAGASLGGEEIAAAGTGYPVCGKPSGDGWITCWRESRAPPMAEKIH